MKLQFTKKTVHLVEELDNFQKEGFTFDMGPSWYWMPDVFDKFFNDFGKKTSDFYNLKKLNPAYKVYFGKMIVFPLKIL